MGHAQASGTASARHLDQHERVGGEYPVSILFDSYHLFRKFLLLLRLNNMAII